MQAWTAAQTLLLDFTFCAHAQDMGAGMEGQDEQGGLLEDYEVSYEDCDKDCCW